MDVKVIRKPRTLVNEIWKKFLSRSRPHRRKPFAHPPSLFSTPSPHPAPDAEAAA
jgi:hypothetical protein